MNRDALLSSLSSEWRTPRHIFDKYDKLYHFTIDLAASSDNALCERYYTADDSALEHSWAGEIAWCNPPYGRDIKAFIAKAFEERNHATTVLLIPARTDTTYWHKYVFSHSTGIDFIRGRISFLTPDGRKTAPAPFPSAIVVFGPQMEVVL